MASGVQQDLILAAAGSLTRSFSVNLVYLTNAALAISLRDEEGIGYISIEWMDRKGELKGNGTLVHLTADTLCRRLDAAKAINMPAV